MARLLKCSCICLSILMLVLPLVCSEDEENNGKNDMEELLQNLLKAEKERRQLSDDTNAKGSRGTEQRYINDDGNVPEIKIQKISDGVYENDVLVNNDMTQKIIKDCEKKYELLLYKDAYNAGGSCYLHKMNDRIYQKDCEGIDAEAEITINYQIGNVIENRTLLSSIKGIDGCTGRTVSELIEASVKTRDLDEYEKRMADRRICNKCIKYAEKCETICAEKTGWWWSEKCIRTAIECTSVCRCR